MPVWHCSKCHHEWEGEDFPCNWCGAGHPVMLEEKSSLEKFLENGGWEKAVKSLLEKMNAKKKPGVDR